MAAKKGSPIHVTGAGKVTYIGYKHGYGKSMEVSHGSHLVTLYAHMDKFNPALKLGATLHQHDIIGYVGATGLATGPHLHYEIRRNGVPQNPMKNINVSETKI